MAEVKKTPIVTLKAQAKDFDFSKLRVAEGNKLANSGETMYKDFQRMDFVINGKKIDKSLIIALKEGTKDYKSELFSKDDIYNPESGKDREIDTNQGRAFVDSVLKSLDKELAQDALPELWDDHCKNSETLDHQKTDAYKKEFERFYNAGQKYKHLLPKKGDENEDYRPFAKEVFKEMFRYAEAEVPSDPILEELVTNCNQAGYEAATYTDIGATLTQHSFMPGSPERVMKIDCTDQNNVKIRSDLEMPIYVLKRDGKLGGKAFDLPSSLEFALESQEGKNGVTYKEGKLSLTIPKELKNYKEGGKSLFDIIKEHFQKFCEKLGFKFETKVRIEHNLKDSLKVGSCLENIELSAHSNGHSILT